VMNSNGVVATTSALTPAVAVEALNSEKSLRHSQDTTAVDVFMPAMTMDAALKRWGAIQDFVSKIMTPGEDYGLIPGAKKPSLLKPGAEKLTAFFGLVPTFHISELTEDWDGAQHNGEPFFHYRITCQLSRHGQVMGEGLGSCNSRESKYRYRSSERICPACGVAAIIKGKEEFGGGWVCFRKKSGCGAKFLDGDAAIEAQAVGRSLNSDVADVVNTILKMAKKRSHVDAVLNTVGASQFFTQDVEDQSQPQPQQPREQWRPNEIAQTPDIGSAKPFSREAAQNVAQQKIRTLQENTAMPAEPEPLFATWGDMQGKFSRVRERVGETVYFQILAKHGIPSGNCNRFRGSQNGNARARACYLELMGIANAEVN
jgi:hypothetical protein